MRSLSIGEVARRTGIRPNAMRRALNDAAAAGANGFVVMSSSVDWAEGASMVGNALLCP